MIRKAYKVSLLICLIVFSGCIVCLAGGINVSKCDVNVYDGYVTIEGSVSEATAGQFVTLKVLNTGMQLSDAKTQPPSVVFNYVNQEKVKNDGTFRFYYKMKGEPNYYTVILYTDNASAPFTKNMSFVEASQIDAAIAKLNGAECDTKEELYAYLSNANTQFILAMDMTFFDKISSLEEACGLLTSAPRTTYKNDSDFRTKLKIMSVLQAVNEAEDEAGVEGLIQTYNTDLGLNTHKRYPVYCSDNAVKASVCQSLADKSFATIGDLQNYFEEKVILTKLWKMPSYGEVPSWITDNNDFLKLTLTKYNSMNNKTGVHKAVAGQNYGSVSEFSAAFEDAVDEYSYVKPGKGGSSGGGGGGNITTVKVSEPQNTETEKNNTVIFKDLESVPWAKESIESLANIGVITADETRRFYPDKSITREEFVKMIVTAFGLVNNSAKADCKDVSSGEWYYNYIASAMEKGIVFGYSNGTFGIGEQITRQDMAVLLNRAVKSVNKELPSIRQAVTFKDNSNVADYAGDAVASLYESGVINGFDDGSYRPKQTSTRAEAAKMVFELRRLLQ